jgi:regulatory protein YycI of two-component signal transduction system YycFG
MSTITVILTIALVVSILLNIYLVYIYTGKIQDQDKDLIADVAEEAAEEIKERAQNIMQEMNDVGAAIKEVGNQIGDIPKAATGKKRPGRKPKE